MAASALRNSDFATGAPSAARAVPHPIDLVHLSRQTMGDRALEIEVLALFDRQAAQISERLGAIEIDRAGVWRADLAHKLKGSARAIGAFEVATAAEDYEHRVRAGLLRAADAQALVDSIIRARRALRDLAG